MTSALELRQVSKVYGSGPTETKIVAGITSFGNGNCAGRGGVFRTDRQDVLDFVRTYLR